ncbi:MAG: heme o synthase [Verrucomicrobia bacterium]|nr:heme o synthase [Verrucomicrobiota bacterium]
MTRPRIVFMVLVTTVWGYALSCIENGRPAGLVYTFIVMLVGTAMTAAGGLVLNHFLERDADSKMPRTRNRPLSTGELKPSNALAFGLCLILGGVCLLWSQVNLLTAFLVLLSDFLYVLVYTPMKRISALNTSLGAIPGAIPPLVGWAAAHGQLGIEPWILFAILFVWQHPHVYAISWMYKDDYAGAGFKMLSLNDDGTRTGIGVMLGAIALVPVSLLPSFFGMTSQVYFWTALVCGLVLVALAVPIMRHHSRASALCMLKATVMYLPLLLAGIIIDAVV